MKKNIEHRNIYFEKFFLFLKKKIIFLNFFFKNFYFEKSSEKTFKKKSNHSSFIILHSSFQKSYLLFILHCALFIMHYPLFAQGDLKIGDWQLHQPYHSGKAVTQSDTHVFWSTGYSIAKLNKSDLTVEHVDKLSGLSGVDIAFLRYNKSLKALLVSYIDNNLDIVNENKNTVTLFDVKNNTAIAGDKKVYDVVFSGNMAYIAYGFGVVALDMQRAEFRFTLFTYQAVTSITLVGGNLYLATPAGIYFAPENGNINLADFKNWQKFSLNGISFNSTRVITTYNNQLYFNNGDSLSTIQNGQIKNLYKPAGLSVKSITAEGKSLTVLFANDPAYKILLYDVNGNYKDVSDRCAGHTNYAIQDAQGRLYVGDDYLYFRYRNDPNAGSCTWIEFVSPAGATASEFAVTDSAVWVASSATLGASPRDQGDGFYVFGNDKWRNYNQFTDNKMKNGFTIDDYTVKINPLNNKVYIGSLNSGLIEVTNNEITQQYNNTNSPIKSSADDPGRQRVSGLAVDKNNNLWVVNSLAANPLLVLKPDNKWVTLSSNIPHNIFQITIDSFGYKWCILGGSAGGMLLFDEGKSVEDISDDRYVTIDNSNLPSDLQGASINCITTDRSGSVWVGTSNGVSKFDCVDPFKNNCKGALVKSSLGGVGEYLLREKNVNTIAIDGANRKWFGTSNGIFVTSSDGTAEIMKFNTDNSPLLSNNVTAINFRNSTGEVFIGTDKGVMIYRGTATAGSERNTIEAYAYPNPVRPDYTGVIGIKGLARDADVKITDAQGNIVFETKALGGQAIWDGKDFSGRRVASGIYLALSTNTKDLDNLDTVVVKILFIK